MARVFDPETVNLIAAVYHAAWQDVEAAAAEPMSPSQRRRASTALTEHIMAAVETGERDAHKLKHIALAAMKSNCLDE